MSTNRAARRSVFTIPPGTPFLDALALELLRRSDDPLRLAETTMLLPTRRACRSLREAFLRLSQGKPLLLPRMSPLGDIDADELSLQADGILGDSLDVPPAIAPLRRQLLLAQTIMRAPDFANSPDQAARLARELARLLDRVQTERLGFEGLAQLAPDEFARHWQITLEFLRIVTEAWPGILAEEGAIDPADRRNRVLEAQAAAWIARPPTTPIIAAGSTGSIAATADLLAVIAGLPQGAVVLPGLDQHMDAASWDAVEESHPQYGLKQLLAKLGCERGEVALWPSAESEGSRAALISEVMRPAGTTEEWRGLAAGGVGAGAPNGLRRIDCSGPQGEAEAIALMMRECLDTKSRTAALITPDRALARRVSAAMQRWGIEVDDSGGRRLSDTPVGGFLLLVADLALEQAAPISLLACLKHPLAAGGDTPETFRRKVRQLELASLRGPRPGAGFDGLVAALRQSSSGGKLIEWVEQLRRATEPLFAAFGGDATTVRELLRAHVAAAEALAASNAETGPDRLWQREDGEAAAALVAELTDAAAGFPVVTPAQYRALVAEFLAGRVVRPRYGAHPRLSILGLLEARLQHADLTILGGLNEGTWPDGTAADPWMSRPMRSQFGLPSAERAIGLSAHDFAQAASAGQVVLTRSERVEGAPTVPSRWLLRLDAVLRAIGQEGALRARHPWRRWAALLDEPERVRAIEPPAPRPPVAARPRRLSVTRIETWMRDPYSIYAGQILRLKALDNIDAEVGAADRGKFIHDALDAFLREFPRAVPEHAAERLLALGREAFGDRLGQPEVWAFWWPRFERIAEWFIAVQRERAADAETILTEAEGEIEVPAAYAAFRLTAKADRIDRLADGTLAIIDYKTGSVPSKKQIEAGFSPQLPLEGVMARVGGFGPEARGEVSELRYWKLTGGNPAGEPCPADLDVAGLANRAYHGLCSLVAEFDNPDTPYLCCPRPGEAPRFSDYAHLARLREWSTAAADTGE